MSRGMNLVRLMKKSPFSTAFSVEALPIETEHIQWKHLDAVKPYTDMPGPKQLPILGNSWRFAPIIGHYDIEKLDEMMVDLKSKYGNIVRVTGLIGHPDLVFAFDPRDVEKVFRREEVMPHRPTMPSLYNYKHSLRKDFFGDTMGVIAVHGPKWDEFRSKVQQVMLQPTTVKKYIGPLDEIAGDFINRIDNLRDEKNELPENFLGEIYKWALESIGRVALDTRLGCLNNELTEDSEASRIISAINTFFWNVSEVELRLPLWRIYPNKSYRDYIGALDEFRSLCMKYISEAVQRSQEKKSMEECSLVEQILRKHGDPRLAEILALDLLLVGIDTTSCALSSILYMLSQNKECQERLRKQLQQVLPSPDTPISTEHLEKLPYINACIKETLRMFPVILGNGRSLQSDTVLSGYVVPKGTHVIFPHYIMSRDANQVSNATKFSPERWLKTSEDASKQSCPHKIHPFVVLPFGYGRRTCLGKRFAMAELQIILAKIFSKYEVDYEYGPLTYRVSPTYVPIEPLKFKLTPLI